MVGRLADEIRLAPLFRFLPFRDFDFTFAVILLDPKIRWLARLRAMFDEIREEAPSLLRFCGTLAVLVTAKIRLKASFAAALETPVNSAM